MAMAARMGPANAVLAKLVLAKLARGLLSDNSRSQAAQQRPQFRADLPPSNQPQPRPPGQLRPLPGTP